MSSAQRSPRRTRPWHLAPCACIPGPSVSGWPLGHLPPPAPYQSSLEPMQGIRPAGLLHRLVPYLLARVPPPRWLTQRQLSGASLRVATPAATREAPRPASASPAAQAGVRFGLPLNPNLIDADGETDPPLLPHVAAPCSAPRPGRIFRPTGPSASTWLSGSRSAGPRSAAPSFSPSSEPRSRRPAPREIRLEGALPDGVSRGRSTPTPAPGNHRASGGLMTPRPRGGAGALRQGYPFRLCRVRAGAFLKECGAGLGGCKEAG